MLCRKTLLSWAKNCRCCRLFSLSSVKNKQDEENEFIALKKSRGPSWAENLFKDQPLSTSFSSVKEEMEALYHKAKLEFQNYKVRPQFPERVYVNNEVDLDEIDVYGFDYDYTLVNYEPALHELIYRLAIQELLNRYHYPAAIRDIPFDASFAIRGLHADIRRGYIFKLDAFHNIMLGTVYRGYQVVTDDEVISAYGGIHISSDMMEPYGSVKEIRQFIDLFAIPAVTLLATVMEYFEHHRLEVDPAHLFWDVHECVRSVHLSGVLHAAICQDLEKYIGDPSKHLIAELLNRLASNDKKLFMITNSPYMFVNKGLTYLIGPDWRDLFDVIICRARKPSFFVERHGRPFRLFLPSSNMTSWQKVTCLEKGSVYCSGNVKAFRKLTGWSGSSVMYFGDHVFSDLADATQRHGWRTGAIVHELERDIMIGNTPEYQKTVGWTLILQELIQKLKKNCNSPEDYELLQRWRDERRRLRIFAKNYPKRSALAHEVSVDPLDNMKTKIRDDL